MPKPKFSALFRRKKAPEKKKDAAQPAAAGVPSMASQIGNQAMLSLASSKRPAGGVKPAYMDELEKKMLARLPVPGNPAPAGETAPAVETAPAGNAPAEESAREMAQMQEMPEMARTSLSDLYTQLKTSKRGGYYLFGNSRYYNAVMKALRGINSAMGTGFTENALENQKKLIEMEHLYQNLIQSCAAYTARNPSTEEGQHRKELVTMIQTRASSDLVALGAVRTDFCSLPPREQNGKSWNELLDQSRTIRLSVKDFSDLGKAEGGQASEVYKLNGFNTTVKNAAGESISLGEMHFFKPEDEYDMTKSANAAKVVENVIARYSKLTEVDKENLRAWASSANDREYDQTQAEKAKSDLGLSEAGKIAWDAINNNLGGIRVTTDEVAEHLGINKQDKINMTRRNVATSRVAGLLGIGNLVAKSETAELYDEATGHTVRGNLMEKAKGSMAARDFTEKASTEGKARGDAKTDVTVNVTGGFQRDLCNLQVLDVICGQIDRHEGNFFISQNESGELSGLQGIDNDAAFGMHEAPTLVGNLEGKNRAIFDSETGEMTLPYMDKNLAERIKALDPDMLRFALKDLLKDEEIEAAVKRLARTKAAIEKTQEKEPERFLEDSQWNDDTAQKLIDQAWEKEGEYIHDPEGGRHSVENIDKTMHQENYFGRMMLATVPGLGTFDSGIGDAPQILRRRRRA